MRYFIAQMMKLTNFRKHECVRIHETEIKWARKKPDFDVDTVIVALKKTNL